MKLKTTMVAGFAVVGAFALTSAAQAQPFLDGVIQMGIGPGGGGVILQDSGGVVTTDLTLAAGIQTFINAVVITSSGSLAIPTNSAVAFNTPWDFSTPQTPLWSVGGLTFDVTSATFTPTIVPGFPQFSFLFVQGTGNLNKAGFSETPGTWNFSTQGEPGGPGNVIFSWSSSAFPTPSVPDGGTTLALLGFTLLGLHGVRSKLAKR